MHKHSGEEEDMIKVPEDKRFGGGGGIYTNLKHHRNK